MFYFRVQSAIVYQIFTSNYSPLFIEIVRFAISLSDTLIVCQIHLLQLGNVTFEVLLDIQRL